MSESRRNGMSRLFAGFEQRELRELRGALPRFYGDVLDVWRPWAGYVCGTGIDATHFLAEDSPEETAYQLLAFFSA